MKCKDAWIGVTIFYLVTQTINLVKRFLNTGKRKYTIVLRGVFTRERFVVPGHTNEPVFFVELTTSAQSKSKRCM